MIQCASCGHANPDGARFCNSCGMPLAASRARVEERKVVTVLFADLVGFTAQAEQLDPEDVRRLLDRFWERIRDELSRYGGTVEKFIGDAVMALFGAPVAHEDDPERAVRAALAIRDAVREHGDDISIRIGVNTGEALVLLGARPEAGEGMAAGDVVNTASRLQSAAPVNGILVGEATWRATRDSIEYEERDPVVAKGKAEPLRVWEALQAKARPGAAEAARSGPPFVGRNWELGLLRDALARVRREREPQLVTLVGAAGIGKSRLVGELQRPAAGEADPVTWLQGRSLPYGDGVTFWALGEMVKAQAGILESDPPERVAERLDAAVTAVLGDDPGQASIRQRLGALVGLDTGSVLASDRRPESFAAWRRFFEAIAEERPLALVFEDLHWADDGLLDFVDYLLEWAAGVPLLVLATTRPELLEKRTTWGGGKQNSTTVSLAPLSDAETAELLGALLGRPVEPDEELLARAGGNPLYAEQFALLLGEHGGVDTVPETVQGLIAARIDSLSPVEKTVLQDASVVGTVFWLGAVAAIEHRERTELDDVLHGLERKGIVARARRSSVEDESEFSFRHVLVRDVAYGEIPRLARARKHSATGRWLESLGMPDDKAEMLAHHYVSALALARGASGDLGEATRHARHALRRAGDRAIALGGYEAAANFYREALALAPPDDELAAHHVQLGRALRWTEADDRARELQESIDALRQSGDEAGAAELEAVLGEVLWHAGLEPDAREHAARARELVTALPASPAKAAVLAQLSRFHVVAGDTEDAVATGREALELSERLDLPELQAHALANVALARAEAGDEEQAVVDLERAVGLSETSGTQAPVRAYTDLGSVLSALGHIGRAGEVVAASRRASEQLGLLPQMRSIRGLEVFLAFVEGRWAEALPLADEFIAECEVSERHEQEVQVRMVRAQVRLATDDADGALGDADVAVRLARATPSPLLAPALSVAAAVHAELGFRDEAHSLAHEVLAHIDSGKPGRLGVAILLACFADALGVRGELSEVVRRMPSSNLWVEATRRALAGDLAGAADLLDEIGAVSVAARVALAAAEQLIGEGRTSEGEAQLRRALDFYRSVGATRFVRQGEALLPVSA